MSMFCLWSSEARIAVRRSGLPLWGSSNGDFQDVPRPENYCSRLAHGLQLNMYQDSLVESSPE